MTCGNRIGGTTAGLEVMGIKRGMLRVVFAGNILFFSFNLSEILGFMNINSLCNNSLTCTHKLCTFLVSKIQM